MNDAALSAAGADLLTKFVGQGGGLFLVLGGRTPVSGAWPLMPGNLTGPVDRTGFRGGTFGSPDYSHAIFDEFKDPRAGSFANMRFFRYRRLAVAPDDRVLARFDDGAAAIVERRAGSGRVLAFTSTLDGDWNDFPRHAMFLPLLHETVKYLAQTPILPLFMIFRFGILGPASLFSRRLREWTLTAASAAVSNSKL